MRKILLLVLSALLAAACGRTPEIYEVPPGGKVNAFALPAPVDAVPAFLVDAPRLGRGQLRRLDRVEGTAVVAPVDIIRTHAQGPRGHKVLRIGIVDPLTFRSVAPQSTRSADFVWGALLAGEAVLTHSAGKALGIRNAGEVRIKGAGVFDVGALADNGTPNIADVLIGGGRAGRRASVAVIGAKSGITLQALAKDLRRSLPRMRLRRLLPRSQSIVPKAPAAPSAPSPQVAGLHPVMQQAVDRLIAASGGKIWVVSGFRTTQQQHALWLGALQRHGDPEVADNWVAPPGHSYHERGLAVDLGGDLNLAVRLIQQLELPLWRPMSWEPWHFEVVGSRG